MKIKIEIKKKIKNKKVRYKRNNNLLLILK